MVRFQRGSRIRSESTISSITSSEVHGHFPHFSQTFVLYLLFFHQSRIIYLHFFEKVVSLQSFWRKALCENEKALTEVDKAAEAAWNKRRKYFEIKINFLNHLLPIAAKLPGGDPIIKDVHLELNNSKLGELSCSFCSVIWEP